MTNSAYARDASSSGPGGAALVVMPDLFTQAHHAPITSAAARNNVPAIYSQSFFYQRGRLALLRSRPGRHLASRRDLRRSHSARREAGGATRSAADKI